MRQNGKWGVARGPEADIVQLTVVVEVGVELFRGRRSVGLFLLIRGIIIDVLVVVVNIFPPAATAEE